MKNNKLSHFKIFPGECDILSVAAILREDFFTLDFISYIFKISKISRAKSQKMMQIRKKSTENIFSVESKSTIKSHKTAQTLAQPESLF